MENEVVGRSDTVREQSDVHGAGLRQRNVAADGRRDAGEDALSAQERRKASTRSSELASSPGPPPRTDPSDAISNPGQATA
ncbi:hypothetical protein ACFVXC_42060 [Streptomyces sp. NPDC058257]|uniref:hypothetical protein n=1 Tax=Streptomyces sp. NPDC058257 TaxID=3346409 RepID=UPI0036E8289C